MRTLLNGILAIGLLYSVAGCATVGSAMGGNNAETGEAWWVENKVLGGLILSSKVYYCPAPANGPAQCKEARMVETAAAPPAK